MFKPGRKYAKINGMDTQKSRKKILKRLIIIIPSVILLAFGITVLGYFTFFPAKLKLTIAGYNSTVKLFNCIDKNMDFMINRYFKPKFESTVRDEKRFGLSANEEFLSIFLTPDEAKEVLPHLNRLGLDYERQLDVKNRKQSLELGLSYLMNPILTARLSINDSRFGFGVDELFKKTITGDMSDLRRLSYFFPDIPGQFWDMAENTDLWVWAKIAESLEIDRKALKKSMTEYYNEVLSAIDPGNMTGERYKTEILDREASCYGIIIKLDENDQKELASRIIAKLKEDEFVYGLTAGNIKKALDILCENEYYRELVADFGLADAFGRDDFLGSLSRMEEEIQNASLPEMTVRVYIDGLDIVKCSFDFGTDGKTDTDDEMRYPGFVFEQRVDGPSFELAVSSSYDVDEEIASLYVKRDYNEAMDLSSIEMKLDMGDTRSGNEDYCSISINSSESEKGKNKITHVLDVSLQYGLPHLIGEGRLDLGLEGTITRDSGKRATDKDYKGKLTFEIPLISLEKQSIGFSYDHEITYGEKVTIPEPNDVLDLRTATDEDFDMLIDEVYEKIDALMRLAGL